MSSREKFWRGLVVAIEQPDLLERDPDRKSLVDNYSRIAAELSEIFAQRPRSEWLERLAAQDVHSPPGW
jgi:crotonobetainyl-CoA:carnitine CoA-transferase CaiB-like acyl-CoA transferase